MPSPASLPILSDLRALRLASDQPFKASGAAVFFLEEVSGRALGRREVAGVFDFLVVLGLLLGRVLGPEEPVLVLGLLLGRVLGPEDVRSGDFKSISGAESRAESLNKAGLLVLGLGGKLGRSLTIDLGIIGGLPLLVELPAVDLGAFVVTAGGLALGLGLAGAFVSILGFAGEVLLLLGLEGAVVLGRAGGCGLANLPAEFRGFGTVGAFSILVPSGTLDLGILLPPCFM
jgi:hypothetical protein